MILLSVILPTCDRLERLERAVDSIIKQDFESLEIIVMDDSQKNLVKDIQNKFFHLNNVKVFRSGLFSPAKTRNLGVSKASGKYITFLDDDDVYMPGRLNSIFTFILSLRENEDNYSFFSSGRLREMNDFQHVELLDNQRFGVIELKNNIYWNNIDIGFVIQKKLFMFLGGFDESLSAYEDWDFIIRALKVKPGFKVERLDYAINTDPNRARVSDNQEITRLVLARKHRESLGDKWFYSMYSKADFLIGKLTLPNALLYSYYTRNVIPLWLYLKLKFRD